VAVVERSTRKGRMGQRHTHVALTMQPSHLATTYASLFGSHTVNHRQLIVEDLIARLTEELQHERARLLRARQEWLQAVATGTAQYAWPRLDETISDADGHHLTVREITQGMIDHFTGQQTKLAWRLNASVPVDPAILRPGLEGTGPIGDVSMGIRALNTSGKAVSWMWDWEDARFHDDYQAWQNLKAVIRGDWDNQTLTKRGHAYRIAIPRRQWLTIFHRVPGLHLHNDAMTVAGQPVPAMLAAAAIYVLNNYDALTQNGWGTYIYVPKIETPDEAVWVAKLFQGIEEAIGVPHGTIKIKMLNERARYVINQAAIMWVLRERLIGPNVGRWDYTNSLIEMHKDAPTGVFPDPHRFTMTSTQLHAYTRRNALLTLLVGGMPIGGMAAQMKNPRRPDVDEQARQDIFFDKLRERLTGLMRYRDHEYDLYRQSWIASPIADYVAAGAEPLQAERGQLQALVARLSDAQRAALRTLGLLNAQDQIHPYELTDGLLTVEQLYSPDAWEELFSVPEGPITIEGIERAILMASDYGFQMLNGNFAAAIEDPLTGNRFMNDLATFEIFWHWLKTLVDHQAQLTQGGTTQYGTVYRAGTRVTTELMRRLWAERNQRVEHLFTVEYPDNPQGFDRRLAPVIMETLQRMLFHDRWIYYGSRVLLSAMSAASPDERAQILQAIFASAQTGERSTVALRAQAYVYDMFASEGRR